MTNNIENTEEIKRFREDLKDLDVKDAQARLDIRLTMEALEKAEKVPAGVADRVVDSTPPRPKTETGQGEILEAEPVKPSDIRGKKEIKIDETNAIEEREVRKEIETMPAEERTRMAVGLNNIGFVVEKKKNAFFANVFNKIVEKLPKKEKGGAVSKFCKELRDTFVRDAKIAQKKAEDIASGKEKHRVGNVARLLGNVAKYGRIVTDVTGISLASPLRYVMMAGMAFTRASEAAKETRLKNEEVIEGTRIADADRAANEAWRIYERAKEEAGVTKSVSAEDLKEAYLMEMPDDLFARLENTSTANGFLQKILRKDMEGGVAHMAGEVDRIRENEKLSPAQKRGAEKKLVKKYEARLKDFDRMLTQYGTVDELAMAGRYAQIAGKTIVAVVTVETIVLSVEKLFEGLSHVLSDSGAHETISPIIKDTLHKTTNTSPVASPGSLQEALQKLQHPSGAPLDLEHGTPLDPLGLHHGEVVPPHASTILHENVTPSTDVTQHAVNPYEIVHKGQGVEHAFIRDIENNPKLAQELGFRGDINDTKALHAFAQHEAHVVATQTGYVDNAGHEVRITQADKVAYEIKVENGHAVVIEKTVDGKILGEFHQGDEFGTNAQNQYEKIMDTAHHEQVANVATPHEGNVDAARAEVLSKMEPSVIEPERVIEGIKVNPEHFLSGNNTAEHVTGFTNNPFNLSPEVLEKVDMKYEDIIDHVYPHNTMAHWGMVKDIPADGIKESGMKAIIGDDLFHPLAPYLQRLENAVGGDFKPIRETAFRKAETIGEYIRRGLQKLAEKGELDKIKF